jgi:membrane protease YdiL (CAAX protease family)
MSTIAITAPIATPIPYGQKTPLNHLRYTSINEKIQTLSNKDSSHPPSISMLSRSLSLIRIEAIDTVKKIALGSLACALELPVSIALGKSIGRLTNALHPKGQKSQDIIQILNSVGKAPSTLLNRLLQIAISTYIVVGAPILEEQMFRSDLDEYLEMRKGRVSHIAAIIDGALIGGLMELNRSQGWANGRPCVESALLGAGYAAIREKVADKIVSSTAPLHHKQAVRILLNGILFGMLHTSYRQGWKMNVSAFAGTTFLGCIYAALREKTGDTTASTTAHILHNSFVMMPRLKSIESKLKFLGLK